jgi:hypothetical protein
MRSRERWLSMDLRPLESTDRRPLATLERRDERRDEPLMARVAAAALLASIWPILSANGSSWPISSAVDSISIKFSRGGECEHNIIMI